MLGARVAAVCVGAVVWLALGGPAPGQTCTGDCNGDGGIAVAELILGVRIGLGEDPLDRCPAFDADGNGALRIEELVRAVTVALIGCPATPTASPSPAATTPAATATASASATPSATATASGTATVTSTPSATPTATVVLPDVSGTWREEPLRIVSSTCLHLLTDEFAAELAARPACVHQVTQAGARASVLDCTGRRTDGDLDVLGTIRLVLPVDTGSTGGCTLSLASRATIDAGTSPTTALYTFDLSFSGACPFTDCTMIAEGIWTRLGSLGSTMKDMKSMKVQEGGSQGLLLHVLHALHGEESLTAGAGSAPRPR